MRTLSAVLATLLLASCGGDDMVEPRVNLCPSPDSVWDETRGECCALEGDTKVCTDPGRFDD